MDIIEGCRDSSVLNSLYIYYIVLVFVCTEEGGEQERITGVDWIGWDMDVYLEWVRRLFVPQDKGKVLNSGIYHSLLIALVGVFSWWKREEKNATYLITRDLLKTFMQGGRTEHMIMVDILVWTNKYEE